MTLLHGLLVRLTLPYLLSDGSKVSRLWLGWVLSFGILNLPFKAILYIKYDLKQGEWCLLHSVTLIASQCITLCGSTSHTASTITHFGETGLHSMERQFSGFPSDVFQLLCITSVTDRVS